MEKGCGHIENLQNQMFYLVYLLVYYLHPLVAWKHWFEILVGNKIIYLVSNRFCFGLINGWCFY